MRDGVLRGWGGEDPDDMAAVVFASLYRLGAAPHVAFEFREGTDEVVAIGVLRGKKLVASFPCDALAMTAKRAQQLAAAIEELGRIIARTMQPAHVIIRDP
jgi:hypothetical protein